MAAGEDFAISVRDGLEVDFDKGCSSCLEPGRAMDANTYCIDCALYFCTKCLLDHNKFPALKSHHILDAPGQELQSGSDETGCDVPTQRCTIHGTLIDRFCRYHDEAGCVACIATKHRSCQSIGYLPDIAKGTRDSAEYERTKSSFRNILPKFEVLSRTRKEHIKSICHQKDKMLEDVDNFKDELICHIKGLAETSKQQICLKYESYKNDIQSDVEILETFMATLASNVDNFSDENEADLFLKVKTGKLLIDDCVRCLSCRDATLSNTDLKFTLNREIKNNITSLGSVVNADKGINKYTAKLYKKIEFERTTRVINGICTMDDGTTVIADRNNSQLMRLDKNFKFKDSVKVSREPYSVCNVGSKEVAALINNTSTALGKVQIVSVSQSLKLISSFQVEFGDALSYDARQDALFICHNNQVSVFTKGGLLLREYKNSDTVGKLFMSPYNLAFSLSNDSMYVLDNMHIKALTKDGKVLWTIQNSGRLICVLPGDIILIVVNNRILQFNQKGNSIGELLGSSDKHNPPLALAFDRKSSRLLIGSTLNEILVYSLSSN